MPELCVTSKVWYGLHDKGIPHQTPLTPHPHPHHFVSAALPLYVRVYSHFVFIHFVVARIVETIKSR